MMHKNTTYIIIYILWISNQSLSSLRIKHGQDFKLVLSTPNLSSFDVNHILSHQLSTTCNLSFLEEVNLATFSDTVTSSLSHNLAASAFNVKMLTFSPGTYPPNNILDVNYFRMFLHLYFFLMLITCLHSYVKLLSVLKSCSSKY